MKRPTFLNHFPFKFFATVEPNLLLFVLALFFLGLNDGVVHVTLNNYLVDQFNVQAFERGALEFPRELPGFLVFFFISSLFFLSNTRIAFLSSIIIFVGMMGLAFFTFSNFWLMIVFMFLWSFGMHTIMPITNSLALALSKTGKGGARLGQVRGLRNFAFLVGAGLVWLVMGRLNLEYEVVFCISGILVLAGGFLYLKIKQAKPTVRPKFRLVIHKKYSIYYILNVFFGVRKQMFLTFAPLVLITQHQLRPEDFAILILISSFFNIFFAPYVGKLVDRLGERLILTLDAFILLGICLGYAWVNDSWVPADWVVYILCGFYLLDHILFSARVAHITYLQKILINPDHLTPTLSLGTTLDHVFAMIMPFFGGLLWMATESHEPVFYSVAVLAGIMFVCSLFVTGKHETTAG